jgi:hypothetical protein
VREVPVRDVLGHRDGLEVAEPSLPDQPVDLRVEVGVAEHVPHLEDAAPRLRLRDQAPALLVAERHRLLEDAVVAGSERREGRRRVEVVPGRHDGGPRRGGGVEQVLPVGEDPVGRERVLAREPLAPEPIGLRDRHDPHALGSREGVAAVDVAATRPGTDQNDLEWQCHDPIIRGAG